MNSTAVSIEKLLGVELQRPVEILIGAISISLNALLLYFMVWKTPKDLKEYRLFLIQITLYDFLLDVIVVLLMHPVTVFPLIGGVVLGPMKLLGQELGASISFTLAVWAITTSAAAITLAFMYRYVCLVQPDRKDTFMTWKVQVGLHLFGMIFTLGASLSPLLYQTDRAHFLGSIYDQFNQTWPLLDDACLIPFGGEINFPFLGLVAIGFTITVVVNTLTSTSIIKHLQSFRHSMSETTYKMHMELTSALIIQAVSPAVLLGIPTSILLVGLCLKSTKFLTPGFGSFMIIMISLHPMVDAICTLYFVKPYRKIISEAVCKLRMRNGIRILNSQEITHNRNFKQITARNRVQSNK